MVQSGFLFCFGENRGKGGEIANSLSAASLNADVDGWVGTWHTGELSDRTQPGVSSLWLFLDLRSRVMYILDQKKWLISRMNI